MPRVKFLRNTGHPSSGVIIAVGATVEVSDVWARRFIANGSAVSAPDLPEETPAEIADDDADKPKTKKGK